MNAVKSLFDFIKTATAERKYAENTARGLEAALKLFDAYLTDSEKESLDTLEKNLDNIANDIFTKQKDGKFTSGTLLIYKRRIIKTIADYKLYGSDPGKMATWNPRRSSAALKSKGKVSADKNSVQVAEVIERSPSDMRTVEVSHSSVQGGVTAYDVLGKYIDTNRSEFYLRNSFKIIIELPVDLTANESAKIKQYIELMVAS